jgi:hypothetical protein
MFKYVIMICLTLIFMSSMAFCGPPNHFLTNVVCPDPKLYPNEQTVYLGSVVADGAWHTIPNGGNTSSFTATGDGSAKWVITINRCDYQIAEGNGGGYVWLKTEWDWTSTGGSGSLVGNGNHSSGSETFQPNPSDKTCASPISSPPRSSA